MVTTSRLKRHLPALAAGLGLAAALACPALAQEAAVADAAAAAAPVVEKGDVAWMMTATLLVLFMTLPGLALFYGGLVRAKNMLSVLMQCTVIAGVVMIIWVVYGYSMAFGGGTSPYWGGFGKLFLAGVTVDSTAATFTDGVALPEYLFIAFQMTFAVITPALIVGAFAERIKFSAVMLFTVLWVTLVYFPIAHMVWDGSGLIFNWGALDFAGGTVVHINAGIAALVGCLFVGKRAGFGRDMMAPHSMTLTMVGASILWVGWFGLRRLVSRGDRRRGAGHAEHLHRHRRRAGRLVRDRDDDARQGLDAGRGLRHRRRSRRGDPGMRHGRAGRRHRARRDLQRHLLLLRRCREEQVRL